MPVSLEEGCAGGTLGRHAYPLSSHLRACIARQLKAYLRRSPPLPRGPAKELGRDFEMLGVTPCLQ